LVEKGTRIGVVRHPRPDRTTAFNDIPLCRHFLRRKVARIRKKLLAVATQATRPSSPIGRGVRGCGGLADSYDRQHKAAIGGPKTLTGYPPLLADSPADWRTR